MKITSGAAPAAQTDVEVNLWKDHGLYLPGVGRRLDEAVDGEPVALFQDRRDVARSTALALTIPSRLLANAMRVPSGD